jgi:glutamine amidotransferase
VRLVDRDMEIDLAQANGRGDRMVLVATEPLTHGEPWTAFQPSELRVFVEGRACWQSAAMAPATA